MNHEIVGPEISVTNGQLRLSKQEAIARHVAQYETLSIMGMRSVWEQESRLKVEDRKKSTLIKVNLKALSLVNREDFKGKRAIETQLEELGIPNALAENWVERNRIVLFQKLKKEAHMQDISISILSLENRDTDKLKNELEGMLKVLKLSDAVRQVIRDSE